MADGAIETPMPRPILTYHMTGFQPLSLPASIVAGVLAVLMGPETLGLVAGRTSRCRLMMGSTNLLHHLPGVKCRRQSRGNASVARPPWLHAREIELTDALQE